MITLINEYITASISPKGAELQSLKSVLTGIEYMWGGDAAYWGKHSPVLFPIVGSLKSDTYYYDGKKYSLPRHGFAREKEFVADKISDAEAVFTLQQTEETLAVYPFAFTLKLRYTLDGPKISCTYEVENPSEKEMLFSVGAHPAFAVPMLAGSSYTDYYLQFSEPETLHRWKLDNGLVENHSEVVETEKGRLALHPSLFYEDAIVLKHLQSNQITLACNVHAHGIHFTFNGFPFYGIWAAKDAPFLCLEPWCGIADSVDSNQQLTDKEGIVKLAANASWERVWGVEVF
jgi:galactose mutarotase-like enzyme